MPQRVARVVHRYVRVVESVELPLFGFGEVKAYEVLPLLAALPPERWQLIRLEVDVQEVSPENTPPG